MKTKRFVSTLLALLLICSLPVSAFAEDLPDCQKGENKYIGPEDTMTNNYGDVVNNKGTLTNNNSYVSENHGTVFNNNEGGWVTFNYGTVHENKGEVATNSGTVEINDNVVGENGNTVKINNVKVEHNTGTVETNNGTVGVNSSTVNTNNDTVITNVGTVSTNNGTVTINDGTVTTNETTGTVSNMSGTVTTNYGTVNKLEYDSNVSDFVITETWYGVLVDNDGTETLEEYCEPNKALDFSQLTKEGYELTGYTQAYGMENGKVTRLPSPITVNETSYTVTCPNVLTLIWQAIVNPGSGEIAAAASAGTGSFGPGSVISINGHKFLLVAVVEDLYCLASVDSFEDEALSDLPALLSSLLTEEQLSYVTGDPELLDEELTARFFAGQGSHIVFPCDSGLIFS